MYLARMKIIRALVAISTICLFVSCGGDDKGGTGGAGGSSAGSMAGAGGSSTAGTAGGGSGGSGSGGATGAGGGGGAGQGSCSACVACAEASCSTQIAGCQANTTCNPLYQCVRGCTMALQSCVTMNSGAIVSGAAVLSCINQNCQSQCQF